MFCANCGKEQQEEAKFCPNCGTKQKTSSRTKGLLIAITLLLVIPVWSYLGYTIFSDQKRSSIVQPTDTTPEITQIKDDLAERKPEKKLLDEKTTRELTEIIADAQKTVFTIYTPYSQGSGFLFNEKGAVVTNAHVVEGEVNVTVKTINGLELPGKVIGYSNETDVAVIHVPGLVGKQPLDLEKEPNPKIGEEVIALGSPLGLENTASMGYITGANRNFVIGSFVYDQLYQISAPISPGSSGGPLLSKSTEKIIAINSAQNTEDTSIGFSIPIYKVYPLIQSWVDNPMSEQEIYAQFYNGNEFFFRWLWDFYGYGYFDGGNYADENDYYNYWEYDYDDHWSDWYYYEDYDDSYWSDWYNYEDYGYDYWDSWNDEDYDYYDYDFYEDDYYDEDEWLWYMDEEFEDEIFHFEE